MQYRVPLYTNQNLDLFDFFLWWDVMNFFLYKQRSLIKNPRKQCKPSHASSFDFCIMTSIFFVVKVIKK